MYKRYVDQAPDLCRLLSLPIAVRKVYKTLPEDNRSFQRNQSKHLKEQREKLRGILEEGVQVTRLAREIAIGGNEGDDYNGDEGDIGMSDKDEEEEEEEHEEEEEEEEEVHEGGEEEEEEEVYGSEDEEEEKEKEEKEVEEGEVHESEEEKGEPEEEHEGKEEKEEEEGEHEEEEEENKQCWQ